MPILVREPDLHPDDLLDRPQVGLEEDSRWWALYCRSRQEKQLLRRLRRLDVPSYCPLVAKRFRSSSGRVRTSYIPLFECYVFIYGDENQRYAAVTTGCVSRWLGVPDSESLTLDLRQIRALIARGVPIARESSLVQGTRVRVLSGVLRGLHGRVIRRHGESRLVISVDFLQQGASVLLDECDVERLE